MVAYYCPKIIFLPLVSSDSPDSSGGWDWAKKIALQVMILLLIIIMVAYNNAAAVGTNSNFFLLACATNKMK